MSPSYREVNFNLRAAKSIERKMIAETLLRLDRLVPLNSYRYVGFGSIFFADFLIFHRTLGITSMLSIEADATHEERFRFNLPLGCVDLDFRHSNRALPTLDWSEHAIVWLDYDSQLDIPVLADIEAVTSQARSWSVLIATVNAHPPEIGSRLKQLTSNVSSERVPVDVTTDADLGGWRLAKVSRRIINAAIETALADRNGPLGDSDKIRFRQLFNFHYADGPKMLTVGGIFYRATEAASLDRCSFGELTQVVEGDEPINVTVPVLTTREVLHLAAQLPGGEDNLSSPGIPEADVGRFARMYRYYPLFIDIDL
jgi:hypothetical protein